jgi:hypothetical protein
LKTKKAATNIRQTTVNQCFAIGFPSFAYPLAARLEPVILGSSVISSKKELQVSTGDNEDKAHDFISVMGNNRIAYLYI